MLLSVEQANRQQRQEFEPGLPLKVNIYSMSNTSATEYATIVRPSGEHGGECNYCNKSKTGRISWGIGQLIWLILIFN